MRILITSAGSRLSQELAARLAAGHDVVLTDRRDVSTAGRFVRSDLGHDASTNELVRGVDAIVHWGATDPDASASDRLDAAMRCTYNLLWAAAEEGVSRFVFLSSLGAVLGQYDDGLAVTERWRAVPTTDVEDLCYHLGEYVCREFAREAKTYVVCLRLGDLAWEGASASSSALYPTDALQAVEQALTVEVPPDSTQSRRRWTLLHIQAAVPNARFLTTAAQEALGYSPSSGAGR